jgi:cell shape-determining protein MreC
MINNPVNTVKDFTVSPFNNLFTYFSSKKSLVEQNKELLSENKRLKIELLTLDSVKKENDKLKEVLEFNENSGEKVLAKVVNKPPNSPFDTFVVNTGDAKVEISNKVYHKNILIGEVEEIYSKNSLIRLYSSPDKNISVTIAGNQSNATGQSNGTFKISLPKDLEVSVGEPVLSSGKIIGTIGAIDVESSNTFQDIYFAYPFKLKEIDWVEIEK